MLGSMLILDETDNTTDSRWLAYLALRMEKDGETVSLQQTTNTTCSDVAHYSLGMIKYFGMYAY